MPKASEGHGGGRTRRRPLSRNRTARRSLLLLAAASQLWFAATVRGEAIAVQSQALTNGMKVLVHEDHSIPSVALYLFYRIGSRNERPGTTGISHFFEHMMFNGAKKYGPKEFDRVMEAAGGSNNAYTSYDVTVYQDWFPATALELIFDLENDRLAHLDFNPKMVESERGVVASERRNSIDASPAGTLDEQLRATAFIAHPYQWPVIGWMSDIQSWTLDDLKRHFAMGYSPANATLVVCGDVTLAAALELARRYLEPIPARPPPPPVPTQEPEQLGERRLTVHRFAQLPLLMVAYHVPASSHADHVPLQALRNVLVTGQSSRLYQRLVDKGQLAISVEGGADLALDPTLFVIAIQPKEGVALPAVEQALYEELDKVRAEDIAPRELAKAKNALLADHYRQLKTISGKAQALGNFEIFFGDYRKLFQAPDEYAKLTLADVRRVAARYFVERNRTVATLLPQKEESAGEKP